MTDAEANQQKLEQEYLEGNEMGIIASNKSDSNYTPAPEGTHVAICTMMVDLGAQETEWQGQVKMQHKVYIGFTLINEPLEYEKDGEKIETFMAIGSTYTLSLNEKAKLRKHLESWRGKTFTPTEEAAFDVTNVLGAACMLSIVHNESNGKVYANIAGISALVKGMEKPVFDGELICYHAGKKDQVDSLPNWIKEKLGLGNQSPPPVANDESAEAFDDAIPF